MQKRLLICSFALASGVAAAQAPGRPDPADPKATTKDRPYASGFKDYRPYRDPEIAPWRDSNEEVGRLGGHQGHAPQAPAPAAKPGAKPPAGRGGHK